MSQRPGGLLRPSSAGLGASQGAAEPRGGLRSLSVGRPVRRLDVTGVKTGCEGGGWLGLMMLTLCGKSIKFPRGALRHWQAWRARLTAESLPDGFWHASVLRCLAVTEPLNGEAEEADLDLCYREDSDLSHTYFFLSFPETGPLGPLIF